MSRTEPKIAVLSFHLSETSSVLPQCFRPNDCVCVKPAGIRLVCRASLLLRAVLKLVCRPFCGDDCLL